MIVSFCFYIFMHHSLSLLPSSNHLRVISEGISSAYALPMLRLCLSLPSPLLLPCYDIPWISLRYRYTIRTIALHYRKEPKGGLKDHQRRCKGGVVFIALIYHHFGFDIQIYKNYLYSQKQSPSFFNKERLFLSRGTLFLNNARVLNSRGELLEVQAKRKRSPSQADYQRVPSGLKRGCFEKRLI